MPHKTMQDLKPPFSNAVTRAAELSGRSPEEWIDPLWGAQAGADARENALRTYGQEMAWGANGLEPIRSLKDLGQQPNWSFCSLALSYLGQDVPEPFNGEFDRRIEGLTDTPIDLNTGRNLRTIRQLLGEFSPREAGN